MPLLRTPASTWETWRCWMCLVSADHPASDKNLAWVHKYGKARVFGYQSGHDAKVWTNESFQRLMGQGIRWAAGRLPEEK